MISIKAENKAPTVCYDLSGIPILACISSSGIADKKSVFEKNIDNAKLLGLMPDDHRVVRKTLEDFGFKMQSSAMEKISMAEALKPIVSIGLPATVLASADLGYYEGIRAVGLRIEGGNYARILGPCTTAGVSKSIVKHIWIRWDDGIDRSPHPRRKVTRTSNRTYDESRFIETDFYRPFQPNPCGNYVGDCVVRALAGVMRISWLEAVDMLAAEKDIQINIQPVFSKVLTENGFTHHDADPECPTVSTLCSKLQRQYHNGERIFAQVGSTHVAAILPVSQENGSTVYKVADSWNSSKRRVDEYWVSSPERAVAEPTYPWYIHQNSTPPIRKVASNFKKKSAIHIGGNIIHPSFGVGTISALSGTIITVDFDSGCTRRLSEDWVLGHCFVSD